jgi:hypothetical protein
MPAETAETYTFTPGVQSIFSSSKSGNKKGGDKKSAPKKGK